MVTHTPTAERSCGARGTPLGFPVVPEVSSTIRPGAATAGRPPLSSAPAVAGSMTATASSAAAIRSANSLSATTVEMWWARSAAASASLRNSVLIGTTSAPSRATAKTAVTKPRPLRHMTPTARPGATPSRGNRRASDSVARCSSR